MPPRKKQATGVQGMDAMAALLSAAGADAAARRQDNLRAQGEAALMAALMQAAAAQHQGWQVSAGPGWEGVPCVCAPVALPQGGAGTGGGRRRTAHGALARASVHEPPSSGVTRRAVGGGREGILPSPPM